MSVARSLSWHLATTVTAVNPSVCWRRSLTVPEFGARTRPDSLLADKAYTSRENRRYLRRRGIQHIIPERRDQQNTGRRWLPRRPAHWL